MKPKITVIGSSNIDLILRLPRFPKPGETILSGVFSTAQGGKGANQAVAAARAGGDIHFITRVGNDDLGKNTVLAYRAENLNLEHCIVDNDTSNGVAMIFVNGNGENCIGVASGANNNLDREHIRMGKDAIKSSSLILLQLEIPLDSVKEAVAIAHAANIPIIFNPAPAQKTDDELLKCVSVLTPNESETEILTGISISSDDQIKKAAQNLRRQGISIVIITLGARGVYVASKELNEFIPGFNVRPVDTTAAGDVFNGALAVAIAEKKTLSESIRFANAAAAISVTKLGAQPSAPRRTEIELFLKMN
jgi:ribokinase